MRSQGIQAGHPHLCISVHGEGFARTRLPVGEAGDFSTLEGGVDEGSDGSTIDLGRGRGVLVGWWCCGRRRSRS